MKTLGFLLVFLLPVALLGCGGGAGGPGDPDPQDGSADPRPPPGEPTPSDVDWPTDDLTGGVVATLEVAGEQLRVWIVNAQTIGALEAGAVRCVQSVVHRGPGNCDHNLPWSWHLDPLSTYVEDAECGCPTHTPSEVEASPGDWVDTYCMLVLSPVDLLDLEDHR